MNICGSISIAGLAGATELGGAADGARWYLQVRPRLEPLTPGVLILDFAGVRLATVSWLREGVIALIREVSTSKRGVIPVAVNVDGLVREEIEIALEATNTVLIAAAMKASGTPSHPELLGHLDAALKETLVAVGDNTTFDASVVSKSLPYVSLSAANNRLSALESKGILKSARRGRGRIYSPVLEGLQYGC